MEIKVKIPPKEDILSTGIPVIVAAENESWLKAQLGNYADKSGIYIQHSADGVLYVGMTCKSGKWGNFAERLRREFQMSSSGNSPLHRLLFAQTKPIKVVFYDFDAIDSMVVCDDFQLSLERKTMILEQIFIGLLTPPGNRK